MDMHVHLATESKPKAYEERFRLNSITRFDRPSMHGEP